MSEPGTIVISALPTIAAVDDTTLFAAEDGAMTQNASALQILAYLIAKAQFATAAQGGKADSAVQPGNLNAASITDATAAGRALLTAANAAAQLIALSVKDGAGNFYLTPYLRYTADNPPKEQAFQSGVWVTVRTIS